jgi:hypothetical protein
MPYVLKGNCVHKKNADGSPGELVKCHSSKDQATAHLRALYANVTAAEVTVPRNHWEMAETKKKQKKKPYGDVEYADPKNEKYPIDTERHIRAAWGYINHPENAAKYPLNGVSLASVKSRIRAAMKRIGANVA